jgi:hypothetical protein
VRAAAVLVLLAVAGFALAACGSGAKPASSPGTVTLAGPVTTTITDVQTGDDVRCGELAGAKVPPPGHGVTAIADGPSKSTELKLDRRADGSLVVTCRP